MFDRFYIYNKHTRIQPHKNTSNLSSSLAFSSSLNPTKYIRRKWRIMKKRHFWCIVESFPIFMQIHKEFHRSQFNWRTLFGSMTIWSKYGESGTRLAHHANGAASEGLRRYQLLIHTKVQQKLDDRWISKLAASGGMGLPGLTNPHC